jgi:Nucleotidyl transferase AbiEii toxin, Type IV TA system
MPEPTIEVALEDITRHLRRLKRPFALVGGLAVSQRAEPRFTRDVDLAIVAARDADVEWLVQELRLVGYAPVTVVEHIDRKRLSTVRLASRSGIVVDLIAATSGIEDDVVARATPVVVGDLGELPVARAEELLAMKVLSMSDRRPQDRIDAVSLVLVNEALDLDDVRANLATITARGFNRDQDLLAKLEALLASVRSGEGGGGT